MFSRSRLFSQAGMFAEVRGLEARLDDVISIRLTFLFGRDVISSPVIEIFTDGKCKFICLLSS